MQGLVIAHNAPLLSGWLHISSLHPLLCGHGPPPANVSRQVCSTVYQAAHAWQHHSEAWYLGNRMSEDQRCMTAFYLLGLIKLGAELVQVCSGRLDALLNCRKLLLQLPQVPLHIPARQLVPFMCCNIMSFRGPVRPTSSKERHRFYLGDWLGKTSSAGTPLAKQLARVPHDFHNLQAEDRRRLKISLAQARVRWIWVPEGVLTVTPCIRPPCHDVVHITDGAVPEEGFVGCAQHPQSIALSLGHQTTLSNMHSWL